MKTDEWTARATVEACHAAWSKGDLDGMFTWFSDDVVYSCNVGPNGDGQPYVLHGKAAIRGFLSPILTIAESMSVCEHFVFENGVGRALVSCFIREKRTGLTLSGNYRQNYRFNLGLVSTLEEIHDAAKMMAFWRLVGSHVEAGTLVGSQGEPRGDLETENR